MFCTDHWILVHSNLRGTDQRFVFAKSYRSSKENHRDGERRFAVGKLLGIDETQKYTIIFLGTFFQLVLMVCDTVSGVDRNMINAAKTLGASKWQISGKKKANAKQMI